jgi:hypothetical protein
VSRGAYCSSWRLAMSGACSRKWQGRPDVARHVIQRISNPHFLSWKTSYDGERCPPGPSKWVSRRGRAVTGLTFMVGRCRLNR